MDNQTIESSLIDYLSKKYFANDYDELALHLSNKTGKDVPGRKILFMSRGEGYAKKWLLDVLIKESTKNGWLPESDNDWIGVGWSVTGDRASFAKNKVEVFKKLSPLTKLSANELEDLYHTQRI